MPGPGQGLDPAEPAARHTPKEQASPQGKQRKHHGDLAAGLLGVRPLTWERFPAAGPRGGLWEAHSLSRQDQPEGRGGSGGRSGDAGTCAGRAAVPSRVRIRGEPSGEVRPCYAFSLGARSAVSSAAATLGSSLPGAVASLLSLSWPGLQGPLQKEMAAHSSTLPGESHGPGSLVGYSPWGRRVRHD